MNNSNYTMPSQNASTYHPNSLYYQSQPQPQKYMNNSPYAGYQAMDNSYAYGAPPMDMSLNVEQQYHNHSHNYNHDLNQYQNLGYQAMPPPAPQNYYQEPAMGMNPDAQYSYFQDPGYQSMAMPNCNQAPTLDADFQFLNPKAEIPATPASSLQRPPASTIPAVQQYDPQAGFPPTPAALRSQEPSLGMQMNIQHTTVAQSSPPPPAPAKQPVVVDLTNDDDDQVPQAGQLKGAIEPQLASSLLTHDTSSSPKEVTPPSSPTTTTTPTAPDTEGTPQNPISFIRNYPWMRSSAVVPELSKPGRTKLDGLEGDLRTKYEVRASNSTANHFLGIKLVQGAPTVNWEEEPALQNFSKRGKRVRGGASESSGGKRKRDAGTEEGGRAPKKAKKVEKPKTKKEMLKEKMKQKKKLWHNGQQVQQAEEEDTRDEEAQNDAASSDREEEEEEEDDDDPGARLEAEFLREAEEQEKREAQEKANREVGEKAKRAAEEKEKRAAEVEKKPEELVQKKTEEDDDDTDSLFEGETDLNDQKEAEEEKEPTELTEKKTGEIVLAAQERA